MKALLALAAVAAASAATAAEAISVGALRAQVQQRLAAQAEVQVGGIQNCYNKCQILLNQTQYLVNAVGESTFEYRACEIGCDLCEAELKKGKKSDKAACFTTCKNTDWASIESTPIEKGIIEPDKACITGCIINNCQAVCQGGSTGVNNPAGRWPKDGCRIVTSLQSQSSKYEWHNSPSGQGGNQCCSNAMSLCRYNGPKNTHNYKTTVSVAKRACKGSISPLTPDAICAAFNAQCGTPLSQADAAAPEVPEPQFDSPEDVPADPPGEYAEDSA
jgi:hypothetical protein